MPRPQKFSTPLKQIPFRVSQPILDAINREAEKAGKTRTDLILDTLTEKFRSIEKACRNSSETV